MRVEEGVEGRRARRAVGVGSAIDIDIHTVREDFEGWMLIALLRMQGHSDA
jgi:hypothetical protein